MKWVIALLINALALLFADWLLGGIHFSSIFSALAGALVLGLINTLVRPVLILITLPLTIITMGVFIFVINALAFALAAFLVPGFEVYGFGSAFWGALITSIVSWVLNRTVKED